MTARCWWRDDDASADTPALRELLAIAGQLKLTAALGVVPERAEASLLDAIAGSAFPVWQHGWGHRFHQDGEFGGLRPLGEMIDDALRGQQALDHLLGPAGWQRVFVPPNHQLSMSFKAMAPALGYWGISAGIPLTPPIGRVTEVNAEIDVMDWPAGRILTRDRLDDMLAEALRSRRTGEVPTERPIGLLTHHLAFDREAWEVTSALLTDLLGHAAVEFLRAQEIFSPADAPKHASAAAGVEDRPPITVVITSCGRQDLLEHTLDSFVRWNTYPACEFLVIEDGPGELNRGLESKYRGRPITWMETGTRRGQIAAIDAAYAAVRTEYIFHCEDDWEFYAPGFIERSLAVLQSNPFVLQVWIRALEDTNRHPVLQSVLRADEIPYRFLDPNHHTDEWGDWHGFSWNPGLRRRREYDLIGSYGSLDTLGTRRSFEVEREVSAFYRDRGFLAAILADNDGHGYVRHVGWGRRVSE